MFFEKINEVMPEGLDLTLTIRKKNGQMTVSAIPRAAGVKDDAAKQIAPFTVSGTYSDLDAGFMLAFQQPVRQAAGLLTNLKQYEEQLSQAVKNSRPAKDQNNKQAKVVDEKKDKYEKSIKRGEELETQGNHSDALIQYQQARLYAAESDLKTVDEKIRAIKLRMAEQSLFDMPPIIEPAASGRSTTEAPAMQTVPTSAQPAVESSAIQSAPLPEPTTSASQTQIQSQLQPPPQTTIEQTVPAPANQQAPAPYAPPASDPVLVQPAPAASESIIAPSQQPQMEQAAVVQPIQSPPPPNPIDSLFESETPPMEAGAAEPTRGQMDPPQALTPHFSASTAGSTGSLGLVCETGQKPMPSWMNYSNGIE